MTLTDRLTGASAAGADAAFDVFLDWAGERGFSLYAAQEEAVLALAGGAHVVLATPTGSGKSLVAVAAHAQALAEGRPSWYTAPIKALVSEKFFALVEIFGAGNVGMLTGDAAVNPGAPIICATAEVLANHALRDRELADIGLVVMDEFHFYTEPDRGWAWQVPLLLMPDTQFLLMSATLGDTRAFEEDLARRTGRETVAVAGVDRPVPLEFSWVLTPVHETLELLLRDDRAPVYVVSFTQAAAVEQAQALASVDIVSSARKAAIKDAVGGFRFGKGFGATLRRLVLHGIGVHHAGMLPKYRRLVETLAQAGLLAVICGTDTLGVGINVPIRTVLLTSLTKYDGRKQRVLRAREFHQIAGRAGRAGFDTVGYVVVQAPEHVVENAKALAKAGDDPKKRRKVVRRKPVEGALSYSEATYERLVTAQPEPLVSKMRVNHAMVLNVLDQWEGQQAALHTLLLDNHEEPARRDALVERAVQVLGSSCGPGSSSPTTARGRRLAPDDQSRMPLRQRAVRRPVTRAAGCRGTGIRRPDRPRPDRRAARGRRAAPPASTPRRDGRRHAVADGRAGRTRRRRDSPREHGALERFLRGRRTRRAPRVRSRWRSTCTTGSPSTSRCRRSPSRRSRCSTPRRPATRSTSSASSRPPSTTRGPCSWPSGSRPGGGGRRDEGRRAGLRGPDGRPRRRLVAAAARRGARGCAARLPAAPPVGRPARPVAEVGRPRDVRAGDDLRGVRRPPQARSAPRASCSGTSPTPTARCARPCRRRPAPRRLDDLVEWLGEVVRHTDSSLLDEWEALANPTDEPLTEVRAPRRKDGPSRRTLARCGSWCARACSAASSCCRSAGTPRWPPSTAASPRSSGRPRRAGTSRSTTTSARDRRPGAGPVPAWSRRRPLARHPDPRRPRR